MIRLSEIISFCSSAGIDFKVSDPLSKYSSLRIGGDGDLIAFPDSQNISPLLSLINHLQVRCLVIGGGTNILFPDQGFKGVVVCTKRIDHSMIDIDKCHITVGAGVSLWSLIRSAAKHDFTGIEGLAGIPGTIGGAIVGNAGSFGVEMEDVLLNATIIDPTGSVRVYKREQLGLNYRSSSITGEMTLLEATFAFSKGDKGEIKGRISEFLSLKRQRQPVDSASAGCVFKNPKGISAGKLIDEAGCKGMRQGAIVVSDRHANFFVNTGRGSAVDYLGLMDRVKERVYSVFGTSLEPEIRII